MLTDKPTVFVVDDDPAICSSIQYLVESVSLPVRTFLNAASFFDAFDPAVPGCILLDMRMPGISGSEVQDRLVAAGCVTPVIVVTGHGDVPMAVRAMKNGAFDFIEKPFSSQHLLDRVQKALQHDTQLRTRLARKTELAARFAGITPRERQVIIDVLAGFTNKAIAAKLGLSRKTVEVHRAHVMTKVNANSLAELVQLAVAAGLIDDTFGLQRAKSARESRLGAEA